jgi:hypothetical protein
MKQLAVSQGNPARAAGVRSGSSGTGEDIEAGAVDSNCAGFVWRRKTNEGDRYYGKSPKQSDSKFTQLS